MNCEIPLNPLLGPNNNGVGALCTFPSELVDYETERRSLGRRTPGWIHRQAGGKKHVPSPLPGRLAFVMAAPCLC